MKLINKNFLYIIPVILLIPYLFLPVSSDLTIFLLGGKAIADGGKIYVDFVDLKQPLIYYIFSIVYKIAGFSEIGIRSIDFIFQLITMAFMMLLVKKVVRNDAVAAGCGIIYASVYTTLNNINTFQIESFLGIILITLIYFHIFGKNILLSNILKGILIGIAASLKITFGIIYLAVLLDDILNKNLKFKELTKNHIIIIFFAAFIFILSYFPLLDPIVFNEFKIVINYLKFYSSQPAISEAFIRDSIKNIYNIIANMYSLTYFGLFLLGVFFSFKVSKKCFTEIRFFGFIIILTIFLFLSVLIERKTFIYHFTRIIALTSVFSSVGLIISFESIKSFWKNSIYNKTIVFFILFFALFFSPAFRFGNIMIVGYYYFADSEIYNQKYQREESSSISLRTDFLKVAGEISKNYKKNEKVTIISTGGNPINFFLKGKGISKFAQSQFYFSSIKVPKWESDLLVELKNSNWVVVQKYDIHPLVTGLYKSSLESFKENKEMFGYVSTNFFVFDSSTNFVIFRRSN